jgi:hypothetical protein
MPSLEVLQRAADSLGLEASRSENSLKVRLRTGATLFFADANGETTCRRQSSYAWMPAWLGPLISVGSLGGLVLLGFRTSGQSMLLNGAFVGSLAISHVFGLSRTEWAVESRCPR